ncbi:MAG: murein hydrolase activator EnvC [Bdellovibrionales bacterium]
MMRWLLLFLMLTAPALAQNGNLNEEAKELQAKTSAMRMDLDRLQMKLVEASRSERETSENLRALTRRIRQLEKEQAQVADALKSERQTLAELLVALARLSRLPPEIGLLRQEKSRDAALSSILLNSSLPEVRAAAQRLATELHDLDRVQTELEKQRSDLANARKNQERERADIESMIGARKEKLKLSAREQAEISERMEKLRREAQSAGDLIEKVATPRAPDKPAPVLALRGGYLQPVSGDLTRRFGTKDDAGVESKGLTFRADGNDRIISPARGKVMFAGAFKGYGQIVIIEHDSDMHSLIGGFGRIDVSVGQKVAQGEPLGLVDGSPASRQNVYFELRRQGDPIDPKPRVK